MIVGMFKYLGTLITGKISGEIRMRMLVYSISILNDRIVSRISDTKIYKRMLKPV
jgi:hypothetical protein